MNREEGVIMKVKKILSTNFISLSKHQQIQDVLHLFIKKHQDIACVIEDRRLIGIVTKYSLYRLLLTTNDIHHSIKEAIIYNPITLHENDNIYRSREKLVNLKVAHAVVVDDHNHVVGIISRANIFQGLVAETQHLSKKLNNLMNNLQTMIISVDLNLTITTLNHSAKKIIGSSNENCIGTHIGHFLPELTQHIVDVIQTDQLIDFENTVINNTTYISSFIPIKAWGQINGVMIVLENVSKYEKIASELETTKRIEKMLDSALEAAYDGIVITDPNGKIMKVNQGFLDLLDYHHENELIGKPIENIAPEIPSEKSIKQRKQIEGEYIHINGYKSVVTQTPIYRNNENIGIIIKIIFRQLELWKDLFHHMDRLETEISYYRSKLKEVSEQEAHFNHIISSSPLIQSLKSNAHVAAKGFSNILMTGESGTGKELFAQGIHNASGRTGQFVKINCAAIPVDLLESELFGYEEGAFTGAKKDGKAGKFDLANEGTLFLDEIGDMPISLQVKLLRVLQDKKFERIGGTNTIYTDARIITATNRDLLSMVQAGTFRADLYYRINVIHLHLPPLRERKEDIPYLCDYFIQKFNQKMNKKIRGVTPEALLMLKDYHWPGNIRELENILERAFHFCNKQWILPENILLDLPKERKTIKVESNHHKSNLSNAKKIMDDTEKKLIIQALTTANGNRTEAAKLLHISRSALYYKMKKYHIKELNDFH